MKHFKHEDVDLQEYILEKFLIINMKVDLISFGVKINNDKTLTYFGKEGHKLNTTKLVTVDFYNDAISFFEKKADVIINRPLFIGKTFYMEYWVDGAKNLRKPRVKPKNGFILSYGKDGKKTIPPNSSIIKEFAEVVGIDPPPILWEGFLRDEQKELLINLSYSEKIEKGSFEEIDVLFPKFLHYVKKLNFEGFVIYYEEDKDWKSVKIVDPLYTEKIKEKIKNDQEIRKSNMEVIVSLIKEKDVSDLFIDLTNTFEPDDNEKISNIKKWKIIEYIYDFFMKKYSKELSDLKLEQRFFDIDFNLIPIEIALKIESSPYKKEFFSYLFKIFTAENSNRLLKSYRLSYAVIEKISLIIEKFELNEIEEYEEASGKMAADDPKSKKKGNAKPESKAEPEPEEDKNRQSLIVGRFQPPHLGHIEAIQMASYQPVICIVDSGKRNEKSPFTSEDIETLFMNFKKDGIIPSNSMIITYHSGYIPDIIKKYDLNVKEILAGDDRLNSYRQQFPEDVDIEFVKTIRYFRGEDVRRWLEDVEINKLKKAIPNGYLDVYFELYSNINTKVG